MGTIRQVKDPHNLSHSRLKGVLSCAARVGYEGIFEGFRRTASAYWLAGGGAVHHVIDELFERTVVVGKVLPKEEVDQVVDSARTHIWLVLTGKLPPRGHKDPPSRLLKISWMNEQEQQKLEPKKLSDFIQEQTNRFINTVTPSLRAIAMRCTLPSPFRRTLAGVRFDGKLFLTSPRDSSIKIPIWGEIDVLEEHQNGGLMVTDWKTGKFSNYLQQDLEGELQMLIYWWAVYELYQVYPTIASFVSLNIRAEEVEKYGAKVLEQQRYRAQAKIRFEEHFPELLNQADDVWALLSFLAQPPRDNRDRKQREEWRPRSAAGIKVGLQHHLEQGRLVPSIGRHRGTCSAQAQCRLDNPEDWAVHESRQGLANVVEPLYKVPDEWLDPFYQPDKGLFAREATAAEVATADQLTLFDAKQLLQPSTLRRHTLKAKDWKALGFFTPKEFLATVRRMHQIIPVINGEPCPCKRTDRIPASFLAVAWQFYVERETHKQAQVAQGRTSSGEGENRVRELYDSTVLTEILKRCPVEGCPHAKQEPETKVA